VIDFARFLLAQQDDERWERLLSQPESRPRLDAFLRASSVEGDEPLDEKRPWSLAPVQVFAAPMSFLRRRRSATRRVEERGGGRE
jgi:hypothetical protein